MRETVGTPGLGGADFTVGVEEEYQLVDPDSGELRSRARAVIATDWTGDMRPEMQQNTIEVQTRPCECAAEVRDELSRLRLRAAVAAEARGLRVVAAGMHPFSHWSGQEFTASPVYDRIRAEYRQLADTQNIFGMHVHVGVPPGIDRAALLNVVRVHAHVLLALSASSPYFEGRDTGYASYRWIQWRRWPRTGVPPRLASDAALAALVDTLIGTGCIDAPGRLYWDVRAHHVYPTVEFRIADTTPRLEDAVAIAALARAMVAAAVRGILREPRHPEALVHALLVENGWRAARYGVDAELIALDGDPPAAVPAREAIGALAERLAPVADGLGDADALDALGRLLERGEAAGRLRRRSDAGDLPALVRWLADETVLGLGIDRRAEQREPV